MPARPPSELEPRWTVEPRSGAARAHAPTATVEGDEVVLDGDVAFVPDAPGAGLLVAIGVTADGEPVGVAVAADADGVAVEAVRSYDATRSLAHVTFSRRPRAQARGRRSACSRTPGTWRRR